MTKVNNIVSQTIAKTIESILQRGDRVTKSWAIKEVRDQLPRPQGSDAWFFEYTVDCALDFLVGAAIRERRNVEAGDEAPEQMLLPGFKRLQKSYSVADENGEQTLVPIDQMTPDEVRQKIAEFDRMMAGLSEHKAEFVRFHEARGVIAA